MFKQPKKEQLVIILLVGILLLIIVLPTKEKTVKKEEQSISAEEEKQKNNTEEEMQQQGMDVTLEQALATVEGVGKVKVLLTYQNTGEKIVEKDETVTIYEKNEKGAQIPYIITEIKPSIRGVLVIAQGGDNPIVIQNIQEAVMALFQVEAHKIKVMKMK